MAPRDRGEARDLLVHVGTAPPDNATPIPRLYLAGDYTPSDYPATLEAAVRSGVACRQTGIGRCVADLKHSYNPRPDLLQGPGDPGDRRHAVASAGWPRWHSPLTAQQWYCTGGMSMALQNVYDEIEAERTSAAGRHSARPGAGGDAGVTTHWPTRSNPGSAGSTASCTTPRTSKTVAARTAEREEWNRTLQ